MGGRKGRKFENVGGAGALHWQRGQMGQVEQ